MTDRQVKQITDYIFKEIFGRDNTFTLKQLQDQFAMDIPRPKKVACTISGENTWTFSSGNEKVASQKAIEKRFGEDEWMQPLRELNSIEDILKAWQEINFLTGEM